LAELSLVVLSSLPPANMQAPMTIGQDVQVFSDSAGAWLPGKVTVVSTKMVCVQYQHDGSVFDKSLPLGSPNLRASVPEDANKVFNAIDTKECQDVEVFSVSAGTWLPGKVIGASTKSIIVQYQHDGNVLKKELPHGFPHVRASVPEVGAVPAQAFISEDVNKVFNGKITAEECQDVEVFSVSAGTWFPGKVTGASAKNIIVQFQNDGKVNMKELPHGSPHVRTSAVLARASTSVDAKNLFNEMDTNGDGKITAEEFAAALARGVGK